MVASFSQTVTYSLAAGLILLLPGAAWLAWSPGCSGWLARLADAVGISIGVTVLAALAGFYLHIQFSRPLLTGLYIFCGLVLLTGIFWRAFRKNLRPINGKQLAAALLGVAALIGLIVWRLYQARSLVLPAWVDSVHHTLVVRLILETRGLPATLEPYLPAVFSYHFGFHILAALFAGITAIEPASAVLWFGQVLNALVALSVFRLALEIWQDIRRAALAGVVVGFAFHMPAYYLTWGRYTLLTGLILLPLAMAALLAVIRQPSDRTAIARAVVFTAGTALSHYTALLLLGFFTASLLLWRLIFVKQPTETSYEQPRWLSIRQTGVAAGLGVLLASPWLIRVWQQLGNQADLAFVSPLGSGQGAYWNYILYLLGPLHNTVWLVVGGLGLAWAVFRRAARPVAIWGLILAILTLPWGLRLGPFRPDHMAIVLFLPASLFAADLLVSLVERTSRITWRWLRWPVQFVIALGIIAGVFWGGWQTRSILNPDTVFTVQADVAALNWVRVNTPANARFIINTTGWMSSTYRGVDGGYWLLPYTGRQTILPPVLYTYSTPEFISLVESRAKRTSQLTTCDAAFWKLVTEFEADYLYIRSGVGSLQAAGLSNCPNVVNIYRQDGVSIYQITP